MRDFFQKQWVRLTVFIVTALFVLAVIGGVVIVVISHHQNKTIVVTPYTVTHEDIPAAFDGKKIVQLSDLHNRDFGEDLTALVKAQEPDIIVVTGDWIGENDTDIAPAKRQAQALVGIAPIYYVAGNHESRSPLGEELLAFLEQIGYVMLDSTAVEWREGEEAVQLIGMYDPEYSTHLNRDMAPFVEEERYSILLFHRPEYLEEAASFDVDLILSGHSHGGQIRLPLIGALYAPNQGWFPKYDVGRFECEDTTMLVCQGLGESILMRILTPPELVVVTLDSPYA